MFISLFPWSCSSASWSRPKVLSSDPSRLQHQPSLSPGFPSGSTASSPSSTAPGKYVSQHSAGPGKYARSWRSQNNCAPGIVRQLCSLLDDPRQDPSFSNMSRQHEYMHHWIREFSPVHNEPIGWKNLEFFLMFSSLIISSETHYSLHIPGLQSDQPPEIIVTNILSDSFFI